MPAYNRDHTLAAQQLAQHVEKHQSVSSISLHVLDPASGNEIYLLFQHDTMKTTHCLEYIHFKLEKIMRKIRFD